MTVHIHDLWGTAPSPLAHYLKALAVLRLVGEQRDPSARLWWQNEHARLATSLSEQELIAFFADEYRPTPILAPWNGGSGFYYEGDKGLTPIELSTAPRFEPLRATISVSREAVVPLVSARAEEKHLTELAKIDKSEAAQDAASAAKRVAAALKAELLPRCRLSWRGAALDWFEAVVVLDDLGEAAYPAIAGSGGNDGRLDFTNNFLQRLSGVFHLDSTDGAASADGQRQLTGALFSRLTTAALVEASVGQFLPGTGGGANMGTGYDGRAVVNPWDFILMLEGIPLLASALARRVGQGSAVQASAPFGIRSSSVGSTTGASSEDSPRGEQWFPLWNRPSTLGEVRQLLSEGRLCVGRSTSQRPIEAARAISRLGVTRGIEAFERVGFLERNGQSNLAVSLGRFRVATQPNRILVDTAATWIDRLASQARSDGAPGSWQRAARQAEAALMAACRHGDDAVQWERLLIAMGDAEAALSRTPARARDKGLRPLDDLPVEWLSALPNTPELRLAAALGAQCSVRDNGSLNRRDPIRNHLVPLDGSRFAKQQSADVVPLDDDFVTAAIRLLQRHLRTRREGGFSLAPEAGVYASLGDVAQFLEGRVDLQRLSALARPLAALGKESRPHLNLGTRVDGGALGPFAILRLAHRPASWASCSRLGALCVPEILARLSAGDGGGAMARASHALRSHGLRPHLEQAVASREDARRMAAALIFPVHPGDVAVLERRFCVASRSAPSTAVLSTALFSTALFSTALSDHSDTLEPAP